ncbi:hypothetical protein IAT40_004062 [Kwoniella sp. CBS 6097]
MSDLRANFDGRTSHQSKAEYLAQVEDEKLKFGEGFETEAFRLFRTLNGDRSRAYEAKGGEGRSQNPLDGNWESPKSDVSKKLDSVLTSQWYSEFDRSRLLTKQTEPSVNMSEQPSYGRLLSQICVRAAEIDSKNGSSASGPSEAPSVAPSLRRRPTVKSAGSWRPLSTRLQAATTPVDFLSVFKIMQNISIGSGERWAGFETLMDRTKAAKKTIEEFEFCAETDKTMDPNNVTHYNTGNSDLDTWITERVNEHNSMVTETDESEKEQKKIQLRTAVTDTKHWFGKSTHAL